MEDKYAILKKLAHQKAKDEVGNLFNSNLSDVEKNIIELKLKLFEQEIIIEELRHDKSKAEKLSKKYNEILKNISVGYLFCDHNGTINDANTYAKKVLSLPSLEKCFGRPISLSIAFEYRSKFLNWLAQSIPNNAESQITIVAMNGNTLRLYGFKSGEDDFFITIEDISEIKKEISALSLIKKAFDTANDAIIITDGDIKIIYSNQAFSAITGYTKHEIIGQNPSILQSGIYSKDFYEKFWNDLKNYGAWRGELADKKKDGSLSIHRTNITAIKKGEIVTNYIAIFSDVTKEHSANEKILELSIYDALTRLPNRHMFINRVEEMTTSKFSKESGFTLLFMDLDNFKTINDTFGHSFGDELLIEIARRLKNIVRKSDLIARLGGDEFVVLLSELIEPTAIQMIADEIVNSISSDIKLSIGQSVNVSCSIGISVFPIDARNHEDLLKFADMAMYRAKEEGKNRYFFYNTDMSKKSQRISKLKSVLKDAHKHDEIYLMYQPQFSTKEKKIVAIEALARWHNIQYGDVTPIEFITIAEQNNTILELGRYIFDRACEDISQCDFFAKNINELAINISSMQIKGNNFVEETKEMTKRYGLKPQNIVLEVTESVLMQDLYTTGNKLQTLRDEGFKVALDDFGTGYSSLSYLQKLPIDIVKIDKSFVDNIALDSKSKNIIKTIIDLSHSLDKVVIAEGVENSLQAEILISIGCDMLQGFYFSKPIKLKYISHHSSYSL